MSAGLSAAIMMVFEFPPKAFFSSFVRTESLYGTRALFPAPLLSARAACARRDGSQKWWEGRGQRGWERDGREELKRSRRQYIHIYTYVCIYIIYI